MTEPHEIAPSVETVADGLWHWRISNANIGGAVSSSHAVRIEDPESGAMGCVLVDPVRLDPHAMQQLPKVRAIVLTARCHQRAAWHYREQLGVEVWMPRNAEDSEEAPDHLYGDGDELPGGLRAIHTPGPAGQHYSLLDRVHNALIVSDLVAAGDDGSVSLLPDSFSEDPAASRASVAELADAEFEILLFDHGAPIISRARETLVAALD
ncbi:MAG: hypothetical protein JWM90_966 [Thermoleophilia bacterium]|nr:hypothetical protein [Thermoleophilia bacterium]